MRNKILAERHIDSNTLISRLTRATLIIDQPDTDVSSKYLVAKVEPYGYGKLILMLRAPTERDKLILTFQECAILVKEKEVIHSSKIIKIKSLGSRKKKVDYEQV